jgi:hypothetical protein
MPSDPDEGDNGERQPDPAEPSGGTAADRAHGERIEEHSEPVTSPTEQEATRPDPDAA